MKKLITLISLIIIFTLSSCNNDAMNGGNCLASVKKQFPNAKIYRSYDSEFTFVVIDSVDIYLVQTKSLSSSKVTSVEILKEQ